MGKINSELDRLAELRDKLAIVDNRINAIVPSNLKGQKAELTADIKTLEGEIKVIAANLRTDHRHTFRGKILQIVYTNKVSYPKAAIEKHIPERYLKLARKTAEVWAIRKAAAK